MSESGKLFALLARLLSYPDGAWSGSVQIARAFTPTAPAPARAALAGFVAEVEGAPLGELQRSYVGCFDFAKRSGLHLTYHVYGDRRERGMALLSIKQRLAAAGFEPDGGELPDFLPLLLEFAALAPEPGFDLLVEHREAIELVGESLNERGSPYRLVFDALRACLPKLTPRQLATTRRLAAEGPPSERVGLEPFAPPELIPPRAAAGAEPEPLKARR